MTVPWTEGIRPVQKAVSTLGAAGCGTVAQGCEALARFPSRGCSPRFLLSCLCLGQSSCFLGRGWGEEAARLLCNSDGNVLLGLFTICWAHRHFSIWSLINVLTTKPHQTCSTGISEALVYKVSAAEFLSNSMASSLNLLRRIFVRNSYNSLEVSQMDNI